LAKYKQEIEQQKSQLSALNKQKDADKQKYATEIAALEPLQQQLAEKDKALALKTKELAAQASRSGDELKLLQEKLHRSEGLKTEQIAKKEKEITSLQEQLKELKVLRTDINKRDSQIVSLNAELKSLKDRDVSQQKELGTLRTDLQARKQALSDQQAKAVADRKKLEQEISRLTPLEDKLKATEANLASVKESNANKLQKAEIETGRLAEELKSALELHNKELQSRNQKITALTYEVEGFQSVRAELNTRQKELQALQQKVQEANKLGETHRAELTRVKEAGDKARLEFAKEKEEIANQSRDARAALEKLQKRSDDLQSELAGMKADAAKNGERYAASLKQIDDWKERCRTAEQQGRDKDTKIVKLQSESSSQLQDKVAEVARLTTDFKKQQEQQSQALLQKTQVIDGLRKEQATFNG